MTMVLLRSHLLVITAAIVSQVVAECNQPPSVANASTNSTGSATYPEGTVIRYDCNLGYTTSGTNRYFSCNGGTWINGNIVCDPIHCQFIAKPQNGRITNSPTFEVGTSITFTCDTGYDMSGASSLTCRTDGLWSPASAPVCTPKDCGEFGSIQYADTFQDTSFNERNHYGSIVKVTCQNGYVVNGPTQVMCEADGNWGTKPTCELIRCPSYPNSNASCTANTQLVLAQRYYYITCKDGANTSVTRTGPEMAECLDTRQWNNLDIACFCDCYVNVDANFVKFNNLNSKGYLKHNQSLSWECVNGKSKHSRVVITCADGLLNILVNGILKAVMNTEHRSLVNASAMYLCEESVGETDLTGNNTASGQYAIISTLICLIIILSQHCEIALN